MAIELSKGESFIREKFSIIMRKNIGDIEQM